MTLSQVSGALDTFLVTTDEADNVHRLYRLFEGFRELDGREVVVPSMFALLERFPDGEDREMWLSELVAAEAHPKSPAWVREEAREFLKYQSDERPR